MTQSIAFSPGSALTFKTILRVRAKLGKSILAHPSNAFCLDLTEVKECDSAGLALLIEAKRLCEKNNKPFQILGLPKKIAALAEFCGIEALFATSHDLHCAIAG